MTDKTQTGFVDRLMDLRTVNLVGSVNRELIGDITSRLLSLQCRSVEPIKLVINSRGGDRYPALALYDVIRYCLTAPVHAIVIGECFSAATFVVLACEKRQAMPHARFVIHSGTLGTTIRNDELTVAKMPKLIDEVQKGSTEIVRFYADNLKISDDEVKKLIARGDDEFDNEMSAEEALGIGLITEIVKSNVGIFPAPETKGT